jgi:hypothetical protein
VVRGDDVDEPIVITLRELSILGLLVETPEKWLGRTRCSAPFLLAGPMPRRMHWKCA